MAKKNDAYEDFVMFEDPSNGLWYAWHESGILISEHKETFEDVFVDVLRACVG